MDRFFNATRIAVIGVSQRPGNLGSRIIGNLQNFEFKGEIIPVGPRGGVIYGHHIFSSILKVPGTPDLAVILTPAQFVPGLLNDCGEKGIKRVVIESGGFGEFDEKGKALSDELLKIAAKYNMRIIGPNGIGVANRHMGQAVSFAALPKPPEGGISIVTQSGGVGVSYCNDFVSEHIGMAKFASIGNKIDVNENNLIEYYAKDDLTRVILAYLESITDGKELFRIAKKCEKPLVIHKANIGQTSHKIAASHSSAIMTDDKVADAMFDQAGIIRCSGQWQALAASKIFTMPPMKGDRLAIISRSGGHAVIAADHCHKHGFTLPPLSDDLIKEIDSHVRAGVIKLQNPLDLGDLFDMEVYELIFDQIISQENIDGVLFLFLYHSNYDPQVPQRIVDFLQRSSEKHGKPVAVVVGSWAREVRLLKEYSYFPIFDSPDEAVWALAQSHKHSLGLEKRKRRPRRPKGITRNKAADLLAKSRTLNAEAFKVLKRYGIDSPPACLEKDATQAANAAKKLGFPVVMKIESRTLTHKTDVGGVALDVKSVSDVKRTVKGWQKKLGDQLDGFFVQQTASDGPELILGGRQDEQFGPLVMLGHGGTMAEVFGRAVIRLAPITKKDAFEMIAALPGAKILDGYRDKEAVSSKALADALVRLSWLLADNPQVRELDINPLRVYPDGVLALDARIFVDILSSSK